MTPVDLGNFDIDFMMIDISNYDGNIRIVSACLCLVLFVASRRSLQCANLRQRSKRLDRLGGHEASEVYGVRGSAFCVAHTCPARDRRSGVVGVNSEFFLIFIQPVYSMFFSLMAEDKRSVYS